MQTPLEHLDGVVVECAVELSEITYVGKLVTEEFISTNRFRRLRHHRVGATGPVISGFNGVHYGELIEGSRLHHTRAEIVTTSEAAGILGETGNIGRFIANQFNQFGG